MSKTVEDLIEGIVSDIRPDVEMIEESLPMTKNHYGRYMSILSMWEDQGMQKLIMIALVKAGANRQGVIDAAKVLGI